MIEVIVGSEFDARYAACTGQHQGNTKGMHIMPTRPCWRLYAQIVRLDVFTELRNRGLNALIVCCDGLPDSAETISPGLRSDLHPEDESFSYAPSAGRILHAQLDIVDPPADWKTLGNEVGQPHRLVAEHECHMGHDSIERATVRGMVRKTAPKRFGDRDERLRWFRGQVQDAGKPLQTHKLIWERFKLGQDLLDSPEHRSVESVRGYKRIE
jgi:hypothetical protein